MNQSYGRLVSRAAIAATVMASLLLVIKIFAWWLTGSVSILAALVDSLVDIAASLTNLLPFWFYVPFSIVIIISLLAAAITRAPMALPISTAARPTPPDAPSTSRVSPGCRLPRCLRACMEVP